MALITYNDKDKNRPITDAERQWMDQDANEVKNVVNTNAGLMGYKPIAFTPASTPETAAFPTTGGTGAGGIIVHGQRYYFTQAGYLPSEEGSGADKWGAKTICEALEDNPGQDHTKWRMY